MATLAWENGDGYRLGIRQDDDHDRGVVGMMALRIIKPFLSLSIGDAFQ